MISLRRLREIGIHIITIYFSRFKLVQPHPLLLRSNRYEVCEILMVSRLVPTTLHQVSPRIQDFGGSEGLSCGARKSESLGIGGRCAYSTNLFCGLPLHRLRPNPLSLHLVCLNDFRERTLELMLIMKVDNY